MLVGRTGRCPRKTSVDPHMGDLSFQSVTNLSVLFQTLPGGGGGGGGGGVARLMGAAPCASSVLRATGRLSFLLVYI